VAKRHAHFLPCGFVDHLNFVCVEATLALPRQFFITLVNVHVEMLVTLAVLKAANVFIDLPEQLHPLDKASD